MFGSWYHWQQLSSCYSPRLGILSVDVRNNSVSKPLTNLGMHVGNIYTFLTEGRVADG